MATGATLIDFRDQLLSDGVEALARERYETEEGRWRQADEDEKEEQRRYARQFMAAVVRDLSLGALRVVEYRDQNVRWYRCLCGAEFSEDWDAGPLMVERDCEGCGKRLPTALAQQKEGGDG